MNAPKELQKIDRRLTEARQALRAVDHEERKAKGDLRDAEAALVAHFEQENVRELHPPGLHNALVKARERAEQPWKARREGKRRLVQRLEQERNQLVVDHLGELAAAHEDDAYAARNALVDALERIEVAERGYAQVEQRYTDLLRAVPGIDGRDVPTVDLSAVKREAQRILDRGVQPPLPRSLYSPADADPTIRSAA